MAANAPRIVRSKEIANISGFGNTRDIRDQLLTIPAKIRSGELDAEAANAAVRSFDAVLKFLHLEIKTAYLKRRYDMDKTDPIDL